MEDVNGWIRSFSPVSGSASLSSQRAAINITNIQITLFNIHRSGGQWKRSLLELLERDMLKRTDGSSLTELLM